MSNWYVVLRPELIPVASMTKERARYVLERSLFGALRYSFRHEFLEKYTPTHVDGITEREDAYIKLIWSLMDDTKSYRDAVCEISKGT